MAAVRRSERNTMGQYPHIRVAGSAEQRGQQYGEQARERVRRSVSAYREVFAELAGWEWDTVRAEAAKFQAPIAAFGPQYLAEMRGIADGAGIDFGDVLAINVRTEVMFAAKARQAAASTRTGPAECSAFAVGLAPAHRGHGGGARGPPGSGPGLRDRGRGRPARQDGDELLRSWPGHQRSR